MTLIVTEATPYGIVMVADSAVVVDHGAEVQLDIKTDCTKLQPIKHLNAAISMWGAGTINGVGTDKWVANFLGEHAYDGTLDALADNLVSTLQASDVTRPLGLHLAGYVQIANEQKAPTMYHVRNCELLPTGALTLHDFDRGLHLAPQVLQIRPTDYDEYQLRNGNFKHYADAVAKLDQGIHSLLRDSPEPAAELLGRRATYLASIVQQAGHQLSVEGKLKNIGGPIHRLVIEPNGHVVLLQPLTL